MWLYIAINVIKYCIIIWTIISGTIWRCLCRVSGCCVGLQTHFCQLIWYSIYRWATTSNFLFLLLLHVNYNKFKNASCMLKAWGDVSSFTNSINICGDMLPDGWRTNILSAHNAPCWLCLHFGILERKD